ncbi:ABC transporter permease [Streptomyces sp. NPDC020965]|uniref:ABC transporter permease n=1 Tax=Streptomyces sp. NPDC020965 TaxID=3365105 RepID=UPI0037B3B035
MTTSVAKTRPTQTAGTITRGTSAAGRLGALGRAEVTLLVRNRTALSVALFFPVLMVVVAKSTLEEMDLGKVGMNVGEAMVTGGIGMVLLLVVHLNLVSAYVARREELVLKRLRTGELSDREILIGTALPAAGLAVAQCAVLMAAGIAFLDVGAPARPDLLIAGIGAGLVVLTALAAVTAAVTRTVESAQITTMPMFMLSVGGSGLLIPLEMMPDTVASVCELLPMTGITTLVRAGWLGGADGGDVTTAAVTALVWAGISVFAVQRWFRWEPRR